MNSNNTNIMDPYLYNMLKSGCEADISKAKLTLKILSENPAGIGDHSADDFYKNAEEALSKLAEAQDKLECLNKNYIVIDSIIG
jgi:hypothetical protein